MFTTTRFTDWDLPQGIINGIEELGWEYSTPVQKDTIPLALSGRDVIGQARTGSGKTGAFDASADDLETLGFISITTIRPFFGLIAN